MPHRYRNVEPIGRNGTEIPTFHNIDRSRQDFQGEDALLEFPLYPGGQRLPTGTRQGFDYDRRTTTSADDHRPFNNFKEEHEKAKVIPRCRNLMFGHSLNRLPESGRDLSTIFIPDKERGLVQGAMARSLKVFDEPENDANAFRGIVDEYGHFVGVIARPEDRPLGFERGRLEGLDRGGRDQNRRHEDSRHSGRRRRHSLSRTYTDRPENWEEPEDKRLKNQWRGRR